MTTSNKSFVCFTIGQEEITLAANWRVSQADEAQAFKALAMRITNDPKQGGHGVPLSALLPKPKGETRSNSEVAAYDFTKRLYWVAMFGNDIAAQLADANVKGDVVLPLSSVIARSGNPYKDQTKRAVTQSFGSKYWKEFVARLQDAVGEASATPTREKGAPASDAQYVATRINDIAKRLSKGAEKLDGTIDFDAAPKLAAMLLDICKSNGVDVNKLVK
jgi:hypothetical protein